MDLRTRFDIDTSAERLRNFFVAMETQMSEFARMCGKQNLRDLTSDDLVTTSRDIALYTPITHV